VALPAGSAPTVDTTAVNALIARLEGQRAVFAKPAQGTEPEGHAPPTCDFYGMQMSTRCACLGKPTSGTRTAPQKLATGVTITANGTTTTYTSLNDAARWLASNVPTAEACRKYVERRDLDKKSANARVFIQRDIDANRLPDAEVVFA